ncbi:glucose-6-phosphate isomerase [Sandarakinorhabdus sp. AAP62]|uniref:glucose-6-phosphate isomerase n=1 Tax=Sandarakinorhabdus sp. AAP62 TaxID=1248916 RepID=UPI0002D356CA|nr:glucose-6-phosphate isomerase [Sandarakinorhabdus sp. AAP62]
MDHLAAIRAAGAAPVDIRALFADEPDRLARLTASACGLALDLSRLALPLPVLDQLLVACTAADLPGWRARLLAGEMVNPSEGRAATHCAERGVGSPADVAVAQAAAHDGNRIASQLRAEGVTDVILIGIGGSALGPALLNDALGRDGDGPTVHVVANIDGEALHRALAACTPATTRLLVVSKTFTTAETMTNAQTSLEALAAATGRDPAAVKAEAVAITARPDRAATWGASHILPFAESVGGRYSLWSAVGLPLAIRCGPEALSQLRAGAAAMDAHFRDTPLAQNLPVLAALADVWAAHGQGQQTRGIFAYDERLRLLPAYLQQLEMESNGKGVGRDGSALAGPTAAITWGGTGTDAQHAVFQLIHQGTCVGPVEFVAVLEPAHDLPATHHRQLLANCFAQGAALLKGRSFEAALSQSGGDAALAHAKTFSGNRPSSTLLLDRLDPATLGALIAFYEHRTFTAAVLLGINPFDQWGVELGKELANALLAGEDLGFDPSTAALVARAGL